MEPSAGHAGVRCRAFIFLLSALVTASIPPGCGSSEYTEGGRPVTVKLKPEDIYKWEGKGKAKRKVGLDLHERKKLRAEMAAKQAGQASP
jgi:hypothetical protein